MGTFTNMVLTVERQDSCKSIGNSNLMPKINHVPFIEAIRCIERIKTVITPRDKLQCLSDSFSAMKTAVVDYHQGKLELSAMDDVLPISIYIISQVDLPQIVTHFNMLDDFIKISDSMGKASGGVNYELEKKILTNYNCGILYVSNEWNIP